MDKQTLILIALLLSSCGDVGSSTVESNQGGQAQEQVLHPSENECSEVECVITDCELNRYKLVCSDDTSEVLEEGDALGESNLPVECDKEAVC